MTRTRLAAFVLFLLVLIGIAVFRQNADEQRNELLTTRSAINQYTLDKQHAPRSLDELVGAGYLQRTAANDKHVQELFREVAKQ